ncbi:MAG: hypothetical protein KDC66_00975 [Phaeodactylibacter sp.]|nr:hypothetical protein [Phaeodactylibacter sp.]MCB9276876.1 hypothetical protein [Lewinellaceae bacterium]
MKDFFLNRQLERIEREANDDFRMILSFGARCYSTKELHHLLQQLGTKVERLSYYRRILLITGGATAFWIALNFLFQSIDFQAGIYLTLSLAPVSIAAFIIGTLLVNRRYSAIKQAHQIERIIVEEIDRRRKDASIF